MEYSWICTYLGVFMGHCIWKTIHHWLITWKFKLFCSWMLLSMALDGNYIVYIPPQKDTTFSSAGLGFSICYAVQTFGFLWVWRHEWLDNWHFTLLLVAISSLWYILSSSKGVRESFSYKIIQSQSIFSPSRSFELHLLPELQVWKLEAMGTWSDMKLLNFSLVGLRKREREGNLWMQALCSMNLHSSSISNVLVEQY